MSLFPSRPWELDSSELPIRDEIVDYTTLESVIEELEFHTKFSFRYIPPKEKRYVIQVNLIKKHREPYLLISCFYFHSSNNSLNETKLDSKKAASKFQKAVRDSKTSDETNDKGKKAIRMKPEQYHTPEFHAYSEQVFSSDFIGSIILNILLKLITNENSSSLVKTSATVQCLWFAINQCHCIELNLPFKRINHERIKQKLVTIVYSSLNKICSSGKKFEELIDIREIMIKFIITLQDDCFKDDDSTFLGYAGKKMSSMSMLSAETTPPSSPSSVNSSASTSSTDTAVAGTPTYDANTEIKLENMKALIYCVFLITQNLLVNRGDDNKLFEALFSVLQKRVRVVINGLYILIKYDRRQGDNIQKFLHTLFKLIYIVNNIVAPHEKQQKVLEKPAKNKKKLYIFGPPVATTHHQSFIKFRCILESILLNVAQDVNGENLRLIFGFFQKHTLCCCNIDLEIIKNIMQNSLFCHLHKICLHFVKHNVLRTIYNNDIRCGQCDATQFIFKFKEDFVALYKNWFQQLPTSAEIIVFLKHIAKISKYPQVDVQSHILVDIVLPLFRQEKHKIMMHAMQFSTGVEAAELPTPTLENPMPEPFGSTSMNASSISQTIIADNIISSIEISDKIIICCLNIFLCYLKDVTVIKAFFIDENIQHLEDLFVIPQFAYLVSNVFKIGVDNGNFLGETDEERVMLCRRLESLQISTFRNIIDCLIRLFHDYLAVHNIKLKGCQMDNGDDPVDDNNRNGEFAIGTFFYPSINPGVFLCPSTKKCVHVGCYACDKKQQSRCFLQNHYNCALYLIFFFFEFLIL